MTKKARTVYLSDTEVAALEKLATALGAKNQRKEFSISSISQWLAVAANDSYDETVAALQIASGNGTVEDFQTMVNLYAEKTVTNAVVALQGDSNYDIADLIAGLSAIKTLQDKWKPSVMTAGDLTWGD